MSNKKKKNKRIIASPSPSPAKSSDNEIDSIIEETRYLSEKDKMEKEAARISGQAKMEEIYSNTSKEVRLVSTNPLEIEDDSDADSAPILDAQPADKSTDTAAEGSAKQETEPEPQTVVTLSPEYEQGTRIAEDIIEKVDSFNVKSIRMKDIDTIDIGLEDESSSPAKTMTKEEALARQDITVATDTDEDKQISSYERLFGKQKPVSSVQTVVSRVPVYQHESRVEKVHVRAGKFSAVVEGEYKKYLQSPNPIISQGAKPEPEYPVEEAAEPDSKHRADKVMGKVAGFFSGGSDDDDETDFKEKTIQIEDFRSHQDAQSIMPEINTNIRKMFVNSIFSGILLVLLLALSIVVRALGTGLTAAAAAPVALALLSVLLLLVLCWICRVTITNGLSPLKKFKGNSDTACAVAAVAGVIQGIVAVFIPNQFADGTQFLYAPIVALALFANNLGKLFMVLRVKDNFKFVSAKSPAFVGKIYTNEDIAKKLMSGTVVNKPIVAYQHETDFLSNYLKLSYSPDPSEDMAGKVAPVTILCSLFVAVLCAIFSGNALSAFSALAVMACVSVPVCDLLAANLPMRRLCKEVLEKNAMIAGFPSVKQFCDTRAVICEASDLYPVGSITLNGVKAFVNNRVESSVLAAAAVLTEAKSPMATVFDSIVERSGGTLPKVESVMYEDKLGLVGWVSGERVLIGSRSLLEKYSVTLPGTEVEDRFNKDGRKITYLAQSGQLIAMFVLTYGSTLRVATELQRAEANGMSLLVRTTDPNVTSEKIADDFGVFFRSVKVLPTGLGNVCEELFSQKEDTSRAYLATRGSFLSYLRALSGCVRIKSNISLAVVIQLIGLIFGVLITATLILCAGVGAVKNLEVLLFVVFWAAAAVIAPAIRKP